MCVIGLFVVWWWLCVVCCNFGCCLLVAVCFLFGGCCLWFVVSCVGVWRLLSVDCCWLCVVRGLVIVVCCLLLVSVSVGRCVLSVCRSLGV